MKLRNTFFNELGFENFTDFAKSIAGLKGAIYIYFQGSVAGLNVFLAFVDEWIWSPPRAVALIVILVVMETITGSIVAVKSGEEFDVKKFGKGIIIMLVHVFVLAMAHNISKVEPTLFWITNAFFGWFIMQSFLRVLKDFVFLKLLRGEFIDYIKSKLNIHDEKDLKDKKKDETRN